MSKRKDPVAESTKRQMRGAAIRDDEEHLEKKGQQMARKKMLTSEEGDIVYMGSSGEIPNRVLIVGNDK